MGRFTSSVVVLFAALALGGCASGATAQGMTVRSGEVKPAAEEIAKSISIEDISGGNKTNPAWVSEVSNDDFKSALLESMKVAGLLSESNASRYHVRASLLSIRRPGLMMGFDMTVTATVRYVVTDAKTGSVLFDEVIAAAYTAKVGDAFVGSTRMRLATEGAARKNIVSFIEKVNATRLVAKSEPAPTASR